MFSKTKLSLAFLASLFVGTIGAKAVQTGLTETVWLNIPFFQFSPNSNTITQEQNWANSHTPFISFVNTGSPLSDYASWASNGQVAMDANGFLYASVSGAYTFNLAQVFNQVDDAARVTIDGNIVAEQNFSANLPGYSGTVNLTEGYHSFDLFYFQTIGGYNFSLSVTAPQGGAISYTTTNPDSVPDGGLTVVMAGGALLGLVALRRRLVRA
jgi:hypothetical protein